MIRKTINWGFRVLNKYILLRYVISGGTSAAVNLSLFFYLYEVVKVYYIFASIIAFSVAFLVSLVFQKYWTFRDHSTENLHIQSFLYLLNSLFGLGINTLVLYICVEYFGMWPLFGQIVAGLVTASCTFFISRNYIFKNGEYHNKESEVESL